MISLYLYLPLRFLALLVVGYCRWFIEGFVTIAVLITRVTINEVSF